MPSSFTAPSGLCFRTSSTPLAVDLEEFDALRVGGDKVLLHWSTASEIDNAGFQILREPWRPTATSIPSATATLVTTGLVQAEGSPFQETRYRWRDDSAQSGEAYNYWLVDIDLYGVPTHHGPISVR